MDGQSSQNELQLMSLDFGGNDYGVSQLAENHPYQNYFLADGSDGFHYMSPPLPQWIRCQQNTPKYVEFLAENGVSELQGDISHSDISSMKCSFQHAVPFLDMDLKQAIHPRLHNESPINNFTGAQHQISVQTENSNEGHCNASQPHSSAFPPKPHRRVSRKRASASDRLRRLRIAERLNALQELLPQSKERRQRAHQKKRKKEKDNAMYNWLCLLQMSQTLANAEQGDKATVLDDIIDLIKYLQAQIKDLSQNRLGGEPTSNPFISLEGYGHYLHYEQMLKQPLEEMMGKLMEMNPLAAGQLLQSRGLFMMPMAVGEGLRHTT